MVDVPVMRLIGRDVADDVQELGVVVQPPVVLGNVRRRDVLPGLEGRAARMLEC